VFLLVFSCPRSEPPVAAREEWARVEKRDFVVEIVESGELEALSQRLVSAPQVATDQVQIISLVAEGTVVKPGDLLVQFDASQLETNKALAEQSLATILADRDRMLAQQALTISNMENTLRLTEYSYEQSKLKLEAQQYESEAKKEQARLELRQAEIDLDRIRNQLESQKIIQQNQRTVQETSIRQQRNELRTIRNQIQKMRIKAPISGMVVFQEVGSWENRERLRIGFKARPGEALISIPDLSRMQVKLYLNEIDRSDIATGQAVRVVLDAYPDTAFPGRVREIARIAQSVDGESDLKGFVVYVDIQGSDPRLKPGLSARVRIELTRVKDACVVPIGTVYELDGKAVVYPYRRRKPVRIALGPRNDAYTVVRSGIRPGMKLAWEPPASDAKPMGFAEEKRRVDEANRTLLESFAEFQKRGILYDYSKPPSEQPVMPEFPEPGAESGQFFGRMRPGGSSDGVMRMFRAGGQGRGQGTFPDSLRRRLRMDRGDRSGPGRSAGPDTARRWSGWGQEGSGEHALPDSLRRRFRNRRFEQHRGAGSDTASGAIPGMESGFTTGRLHDTLRTGPPAAGAGPVPEGAPDSLKWRSRMQWPGPEGEVPPDGAGRRFRQPSFGPDGSMPPDSAVRRFRRDGFGPGFGRPPDSLLERLQKEGKLPSREQMRERMQRYREMRKEAGNEDSDSVPEKPKE
jgi:RND family efflux transporter MFP subunit